MKQKAEASVPGSSAGARVGEKCGVWGRREFPGTPACSARLGQSGLVGLGGEEGRQR